MELAARMEDFVCGFYADANLRTESQQSKEFFLEMLEKERGHPRPLEESIAYLENPKALPALGGRPSGVA